MEAEDQNNEEKVVSLVLSALALLRETPLKPNSFVSLSLLAIAKKRHMVFQKRKILKALVSLLKKEASPQNLTQNSTMSLKPAFLLQGPSKTSSGVALPLLACNLLYAACKDISIWPHDFAMAYLEDAISDRVWVDHLEAKLFVDNLLTAFPGASPVEQRGELPPSLLSRAILRPFCSAFKSFLLFFPFLSQREREPLMTRRRRNKKIWKAGWLQRERPRTPRTIFPMRSPGLPTPKSKGRSGPLQ